MKILVANNQLNQVGGSETFTYTLIEGLKKYTNAEIEYFTFEKGKFALKIENELQVQFMSQNKYDLILANHNTCVKELFRKGFIIQTCHGIFPQLEQASIYADAYVSISQEIQTHLALKGINSRIIYNPINTEKFCLNQPLNQKLKRILSLCHSDEANEIIQKACQKSGIELLINYKYKNPSETVEKTINQVDMVIGLGRSAYEAMSCERPVIVFDKRYYMESFADGYVADILGLSLQNNCSGRYFKYNFNEDDLVQEFSKYNSNDGKILRKFVEKELAVEKVIEKYFEYFKQINQSKSKINYQNLKNISGKKISSFLLEIKHRIDNVRYKKNS